MLRAACQGRRTRRRFLRAAVTSLAVLGGGPGPVRQALGAGPPTDLTLREASGAVRAGTRSAVELTAACLARIERAQPVLNAFITVTPDAALASARALDEEGRRGAWRGPLHGVPIALKDNLDTAGVRTTAASALFADRVPAADAEVVRRLRAAGAVLLGKLNMDEFSVGGTSTTSYFGPVHNPWALDRSAGGSSGGAGAAVAARLCFGAIGTDTSGSLRIPAAFCGVVGLKPTFGRVSTRGVVPLSWTLDHVGAVARSVEDAALLLGVIAGHDPRDPGSLDAPVPDYAAAARADVRGLRLGVPRAHFYDRLHPDVAQAVSRAIEVLRALAGSVRDVQLPSLVTAPDVTPEEAAAYHAEWFQKVPFLYQPALRRRLGQWTKATALDYVLARREIERLRLDAGALFADADLLVTPTVMIPPRTIQECLARAASEQPLPPEPGTTAAFNALGLPAISVPCGFTTSGLPVGLQIAGPRLGEGRVLALAGAYERATGWSTRQPTLPV